MIFALLACSVDLGDRSAAANADCGSCHPEHQAAFDLSRHAAANQSELFEHLEEDAEREFGSAGGCAACHAPNEAFTCLTCHAAAGNRGTSQGRLITDEVGPVRGATDRDDAPHATQASGFLVDSALCGTCHDVDAPAGFDEHPYQAWLESPAAAEGKSCQTCHMPPTSYGTSHRFQGISGDSVAALDLLDSGVSMRFEQDLVLKNLTGHHFPDGASALREVWLVPDVGERVPLHAELRRDGRVVNNPVQADQKRMRGLVAGETRILAFDRATEVCLTYRPVRRALSDELGLPEQPMLTLRCVSR